MALFKVTVRSYNDKNRPHLKWVVNTHHPVKGRRRRMFATRAEADGEAHVQRVEVEQIGLAALELSPRQRVECLDAYERLRPLGASLTQVVSEFVDRKTTATATVQEFVAGLHLNPRRVRTHSKMRTRSWLLRLAFLED